MFQPHSDCSNPTQTVLTPLRLFKTHSDSSNPTQALQTLQILLRLFKPHSDRSNPTHTVLTLTQTVQTPLKTILTPLRLFKSHSDSSNPTQTDCSVPTKAVQIPPRLFKPYSDCSDPSRTVQTPLRLTRRGSSIGSVFAWHVSGPEFDPHVWHILSWRLGHENISTAILSLPLFQEEQLSVTGERMCTKYC